MAGSEHTRDSGASPGMWLLEEPLLYNSFITLQILSSSSLHLALQKTGCVKVGHLLQNAKRSLDALAQKMEIRSSRVLGRLVKEVRASLPGPMRGYVESCDCEQWDDGGPYSFPSLTVAPVVEEWQEEGDKLLTFVTPRLGKFEALEKKATYQLCVKVCHLRSLVSVKVSKFGQNKSPRGSWRSLYKLPVEKRAADLQWRIIHGAIATNRHIAHLDPGHGGGLSVLCTGGVFGSFVH